MIVSINQPAYLPWKPYLDRITMSDLHIVLDHVQFEKGSFVNRTRIQLPDGRISWLTIPVEKGKPIRDTQVVGDAWRRKHRETLRQIGVSEDFLNCWELPWKPPHGLILALTALTRKMIEPERRFQWPNDWLWSSSLKPKETKSALVLELCQKVGATIYLSGPLGRNYLDLPAFEQAGIEIRFHDYQPPDPPVSYVHRFTEAQSGIL